MGIWGEICVFHLFFPPFPSPCEVFFKKYFFQGHLISPLLQFKNSFSHHFSDWASHSEFHKYIQHSVIVGFFVVVFKETIA